MDQPTQALTLMIVYVLTTAFAQLIGFVISRGIDYQWPTLGLTTFLILFLAAFGLAWPIAVRIAEWLIRSRGYVVEDGAQALIGCRHGLERPAARPLVEGEVGCPRKMRCIREINTFNKSQLISLQGL